MNDEEGTIDLNETMTAEEEQALIPSVTVTSPKDR